MKTLDDTTEFSATREKLNKLLGKYKIIKKEQSDENEKSKQYKTQNNEISIVHGKKDKKKFKGIKAFWKKNKTSTGDSRESSENKVFEY